MVKRFRQKIFSSKENKETFWAALSKIISLLGGLVILLLVPKFAGVEIYGTFVLLLAYQSIIGLFAGNPIQTAIKKEISEHKFDKISKLFFLEGIKLKICFSIIISLIFLLIICLTNIDFIEQYFLLLIVLVFVMNLWGTVIAAFEAAHRLFFEAVLYFLEYTTKTSIILIFLNYLSVNILMFSFILGYLVAFLVGIVIIIRQFRGSCNIKSFFSFNKKIAKKILIRTFYLSLASISLILLNKIDLIMISFLLDVESVGFYGIASDIMKNAAILSAPIILGVVPLFVKKDIKKLFSKTTKKLILVNGSIFLFVFLFSDFVVNLIYGPEFQMVSLLLKIFAIFPLLASLQSFSQEILILKDRTKQIFIFGLLAVLLNIFLNYFFIIGFGITGAAIATIISYTFWATISSFYVFKLGQKHS